MRLENLRRKESEMRKDLEKRKERNRISCVSPRADLKNINS